MRKLVCDLCGKELALRDCYDEDGYSQYVSVEINNNRKYDSEYDICNNCYEDILKYVKEKGEWIEGENGNIKCNKCGCEIRYSYLIGNKPDFPKFCCECGSKMKGGAE